MMTTVSEIGGQMQSNYIEKVLMMINLGLIGGKDDLGKPRIQHIDIKHDDWCGIFQGNLCDCDPDVKISEVDRDGR